MIQDNDSQVNEYQDKVRCPNHEGLHQLYNTSCFVTAKTFMV